MLEILLAQQDKYIGGSLWGLGFLGDPTRFTTEVKLAGTLNAVMSLIIGVLTISAGLWFIIQFFLGAFSWLTAGADKTSLENAQKKLTNSIIGLIVVVAAIFFIEIIGNLVGLKILQPGEFLLNIGK